MYSELSSEKTDLLSETILNLGWRLLGVIIKIWISIMIVFSPVWLNGCESAFVGMSYFQRTNSSILTYPFVSLRMLHTASLMSDLNFGYGYQFQCIGHKCSYPRDTDGWIKCAYQSDPRVHPSVGCPDSILGAW